ncbi:PhnB protein [Motilibacter rhizosphaerae]|uniref:PhnB protein n=1 Tax=Motilibacter rhizosphaerae TaxID=598652 RepID=A0A4Q7NRX1_9ACTN|nr:VOC family protein [Motilibacter rhizosphaerae]RZS89853.1 PhnB protein [Motilibacter rhizosphaerae]
MTSRLTPYLGFRDDARQAFELYQRVLGGTLEISTFGQFGAAEGPDAELVMHAQLTTDLGLVLMGADTPSGMTFADGARVAVSIVGDDGDALRGYFAGLADGGAVTMPLERQVWGDEFGMLTDRYGIAWMVNITGG